MPHIERCVCTNQRFDRLLKMARAEHWNLQQLMTHSGAADGCGRCRPYLRQVLDTGQVTFDRLLPAEGASDCGSGRKEGAGT